MVENQTQLSEQLPVKKSYSPLLLTIGVLLYTLSIISSFFGGYYLQGFLSTNDTPPASTTPTPSVPPTTSEIPEDNTTYEKGKQYFDDTIIAITNDNKHTILIATAARQETQNGANQSTRVSFFDGDKWTRKTMTKHNDTSAIYTNDIITKWQIDIDPTRVLKQDVQGSIRIDQNLIDFDTNTVTNNIAVRSLPGYTKFISTGEGNVTINGEVLKAKILYTRIYSNNSEEIQFYDTPFGLTTHWLAFWDNDGNFYHIDSTKLDKPTEKYQTHEFGTMVDKDGRVSKTFEVNIQTDSENPPHSYRIQLGTPINQSLTFTTQSSINKAPNNSYSWFMSSGTGQIGSTAGYGIVEYIHN